MISTCLAIPRIEEGGGVGTLWIELVNIGLYKASLKLVLPGMTREPRARGRDRPVFLPFVQGLARPCQVHEVILFSIELDLDSVHKHLSYFSKTIQCSAKNSTLLGATNLLKLQVTVIEHLIIIAMSISKTERA
jgi:hypothetical protein